MKRRDFIVATGTTLGASQSLALPFIFKKIEKNVCVTEGDLNPTVQIIETLKRLAFLHHGFPVNQLEHALQSATRARKLGLSRELIVASLCHDMAKVISSFNHEAMAAEMLRPYVSDDVYNVLRYHGIFQGRFYWKYIDRNDRLFEIYQHEPWFDLAMNFTQEVDAPAFDPKFKSDPLESFREDIAAIINNPITKKSS